MMNDFEDAFRVTPLYLVIGSFVLAMLLDFMPFPFDTFFWLPELTALTLLYWAIYRPKWAGLGLAFIVGLLVDVGSAVALGLHAISYVVMVFFLLRNHRKLLLYGHVMQLFMVWLAMMCNQVILVVLRLFINHQLITWQSFIAPFVAVLIWPLFSQFMLIILNSKRKH